MLYKLLAIAMGQHVSVFMALVCQAQVMPYV